MTDTRRVVINKCFGGFGLSPEAERALVGKCEHTTLMEPAEYYGNRPGWEKDFERDTTDKDRIRLGFGPQVVDGKIIIDEHRSTYQSADARACPALIDVVQRLGKRAAGMHAELVVVEIPADVKWGIHEYDGLEHVEEDHRTWG